MFFKRINLIVYDQLILNKCHIGGLCPVNMSFYKYIFGFRNRTFLYDLVYLRFFLQVTLTVIINSVNTYYDKVLMVNSNLNYSYLFKDLCQKMNMPYIYSRWVAGSLTNFHFFSTGSSLFKRNHFEGFYNLGFVPGLIMLLNGDYNRPVLKEGRVLDSVLFGIADFEPSNVACTEVNIIRHGCLNYPTLMNDDTNMSLNLYMYFMVNAIYARKLLIANLIYFEFDNINLNCVVPFFLGRRTFFRRALGYKQGRICSFYKNRTKFSYFTQGQFIGKYQYFFSKIDNWSFLRVMNDDMSTIANEWEFGDDDNWDIAWSCDSSYLNYNYSLYRFSGKRHMLEKMLILYKQGKSNIKYKTDVKFKTFFIAGKYNNNVLGKIHKLNRMYIKSLRSTPY